MQWEIKLQWEEIKCSSKNIMSKSFKSWVMKNIFRKLPANKSLIVIYLQDNQKNYRSRLFTEFIQTQKKCPIYLKKMSIPFTCNWNNKPNFFLWTRPLNNLILAKYLTYVFATLRKIFLQNTSKWLFLELTDLVWSSGSGTSSVLWSISRNFKNKHIWLIPNLIQRQTSSTTDANYWQNLCYLFTIM